MHRRVVRETAKPYGLFVLVNSPDRLDQQLLGTSQKVKRLVAFRTNPGRSDSCTTATIVPLDLNRKRSEKRTTDGIVTTSADN